MPNLRPAENIRENIREEHLEDDFRRCVREGIKDTRDSIAAINVKVGHLSEKFELMDRANERQHHELGTRVDELAAKWAANQELLTLKYERALEDCSDRLTSKNLIIRGCVAVILLLVGILLEAKFKISEVLKLLGLGG